MSLENLKMAEDYLTAMGNHDLEAVGKNLDPGVHFKAPLAETHDREAFLENTKKLFTLMKRVEARARFDSQNQTLLVYDMLFAEPLGRVRATNLMTFTGGKIKEIELLYDARPFEKFFQSRS